MTKARSPHPATLGMPQKQKEQYEKQLKVEFERKSQQIEAQLEKRNKCNLIRTSISQSTC